MKKTPIALVLAAAVVSGSAMAWTVNGSGGNVELGGTLTPVEKATPWEVKVGDVATDLDAQFQAGQKLVEITLKKAVPIMGIRTRDKTAFKGKPGVTPQIDFGDAVDMNGFVNGVTTLTLAVNDSEGAKIGTITAPLSTIGVASVKSNVEGVGGGWGWLAPLYAANARDAFFGGLARSASGASKLSQVEALLPDAADNFDMQKLPVKKEAQLVEFSPAQANFSAYYAAGIESGKLIRFVMDSVVSADAPLQWKASLPVIVTYM